MKDRFKLYRRSNRIWYSEDKNTRMQTSLQTRSKGRCLALNGITEPGYREKD